MQEASLILSIMALCVSLGSLTWQLAKALSTHQIQMVPLDPFAPTPHQNPGKPIVEEFREFDAPLTEEEEEYFRKHNKN